MTTTLTVTGRDTDRDAFALADNAEMVGGSRLHGREGWQILTNDGWETITRVESRPWRSLYVHTVESDSPWIRSTDPLADGYLAQVRKPAEMTVVKTRSGWAVSAGFPFYLKETRTKREAQAFIDWASRTQAELAECGHAGGALMVDFLRRRGLEPVDYRTLKPGDLYAATITGPVREVTRVEHMPSGASMVWHETDDMPPGSCDRFTLHASEGPVFRTASQPTPRQEAS